MSFNPFLFDTGNFQFYQVSGQVTCSTRLLSVPFLFCASRISQPSCLGYVQPNPYTFSRYPHQLVAIPDFCHGSQQILSGEALFDFTFLWKIVHFGGKIVHLRGKAVNFVWRQIYPIWVTTSLLEQLMLPKPIGVFFFVLADTQ